LPFGLNILHVLAFKGMRGNWKKAFHDGIDGYYLDIDGKTPLDYSHEKRDQKFSEMMLELT
jgi:hypothetical protein